MDSDISYAQVLCQGIFIFVITTLFLNWLGPRLKRQYYAWTKSGPLGQDEIPNSDSNLVEQYKEQQEEYRERTQQQYDSQSLDYKERILIPREERKRRKKEEEFAKFLGPAWKGKGTTLGGGESASSGEDVDDGSTLQEGRKAAHKRKVREQINEKVAASAAAAAAARQKPKRIIKLPEEPDASEDGVICVMLRTPIGTTCHRRFYIHDKIQCLFDYITTQGFSQRRYTVSTSYPRSLISDPDSCFADYNLGKRVALNIEEKD